VANGTQRAVLTGHTDAVGGCAFSLDGKLLATASDDRTARLWRVADGTEWAVLAGHTSWAEDCAFSPDGTLLATVSRDGTLRLWHVATRRCHCALRTGPSLTGVTWHPDGAMICVAGGAGTYLLAYQPPTSAAARPAR
jgi:WD40 repeat protein